MQRRSELRGEPEPSAVRQARAWVTATLMVWNLDRHAQAAALVTSELVTNVVLHARTPFRLSLEADTARVLIEVEDGSTDPAQAPAQIPDLSMEGRGLRAVAALSSDWGCRLLSEGKVVWAEMRLDD